MRKDYTRFVFTQQPMSPPSCTLNAQTFDLQAWPWPRTGMVRTWVLHIASMRWTSDPSFMKILQAVSEIWSGHNFGQTDERADIQDKNNISHYNYDIAWMILIKIPAFQYHLSYCTLRSFLVLQVLFQILKYDISLSLLYSVISHVQDNQLSTLGPYWPIYLTIKTTHLANLT